MVDFDTIKYAIMGDGTVLFSKNGNVELAAANSFGAKFFTQMVEKLSGQSPTKFVSNSEFPKSVSKKEAFKPAEFPSIRPSGLTGKIVLLLWERAGSVRMKEILDHFSALYRENHISAVVSDLHRDHGIVERDCYGVNSSIWLSEFGKEFAEFFAKKMTDPKG